MPIDLLNLIAKFRDVDDRTTPDAYFRTRVPSVARGAYLNIVYKRPSEAALREVDEEIGLPPQMKNFYRQWNGARFFVGAMAVNGCLPAGQQIDRQHPFSLLPFDIREENREFARQGAERGLICIGSYSFDGSIVTMRRDNQGVACHVGQKFSQIRCEWSSLNEWLGDELRRLALLFDEDGNLLVRKEEMLPPARETRVM